MISIEKNFGKIEKKNFEIFPGFFFSLPRAEPEGDRREPKGEFELKLTQHYSFFKEKLKTIQVKT